MPEATPHNPQNSQDSDQNPASFGQGFNQHQHTHIPPNYQEPPQFTSPLHTPLAQQHFQQFNNPVQPPVQPSGYGNPLQQYFRRPAIHVKLPSGTRFYPSDVVEYPPTGELPVFPMTAIDEITARTPDATFNGSAVAKIIQSCIPAIKNPWQISMSDMDSILISIKIASYGESIDVESMCPSCSEVTEYKVDLVSSLSNLRIGDFESTLDINGLNIKFTSLDFEQANEIALENFTLQKTLSNLMRTEDLSDEEKSNITQDVLTKITNLNLHLAANSIDYIKTPDAVVTNKDHIKEWLTNCSKEVFDQVIAGAESVRDPSQIKPLDVDCPKCEHHYQQVYSVNPTDFFG